MDDRRSLPVVGPAGSQDDTACGPKVYVSNEESALLTAMRRVREEALEIRRELARTTGTGGHDHLEERLTELRREWEALAARRQHAYRRKMVMLGHMPPDAEWPAP